MDLIAREFSVRPLTGDYDGAAFGVHLDGVLIGGFEGQKEECSQHFDYVIVGMVVVVEQNDVEQLLEALGIAGSGFWISGGGWQPSNGRMKWKGGATDSTGLIPSWEVVPGSELP